ncbi:MAG: hypothetical protein M0C28_13025 [Candidatus Moduliflexus flocculans]|nr:hypothetical protein [Candidatus Moduliflexus flocculans]
MSPRDTNGRATISRLDARARRLRSSAGRGPDARLRARRLSRPSGRLDLGPGSDLLTSLEARLPGLAPLRLAGRYGFGQGGAAELRLESRGLDVAALRGPGRALPSGGRSPAGTSAARLTSRSPPAGRPAARADWTVSPDGSPSAGARFNDPVVHRRRRRPRSGRHVRGRPVRRLAGPSRSRAASPSARANRCGRRSTSPGAKHPLALAFGGRYDPGTGAVDGLTARVARCRRSAPSTSPVRPGRSPAPSFDLRDGGATRASDRSIPSTPRPASPRRPG